MSSNFYYGIKEVDCRHSFPKAQWLTARELVHRMKSYSLDSLVHPNEPIFNEENNSNNVEEEEEEEEEENENEGNNKRTINKRKKEIVDLIVLAKHTDKWGSLKLKATLLSQLVSSQLYSSNLQQPKQQQQELCVLNLPTEDSYIWKDLTSTRTYRGSVSISSSSSRSSTSTSSSSNSSSGDDEGGDEQIPELALRAGYDHNVKQFSYIGRMKTKSSQQLNQISRQQDNNNNISNSKSGGAEQQQEMMNNGLIGTLTHLYEYIPSICLKLEESPFLKHRQQTVQQEGHEQEQHHHHQVLCVIRRPATLKQLCKLTCLQLDEQAPNVYFARKSLPTSMRVMLWPSYLEPGECLIKQTGKMRSANGAYELSINRRGMLRFISLHHSNNKNHDHENFPASSAVTFEKNVESLLVNGHGVYLIFDSKQATRKPTLIYNHNNGARWTCWNKNETLTAKETAQTAAVIPKKEALGSMFDRRAAYVLELSNLGMLRIVTVSSRQNPHPQYLDLLDLNEYLTCCSTPSLSLSTMARASSPPNLIRAVEDLTAREHQLQPSQAPTTTPTTSTNPTTTTINISLRVNKTFRLVMDLPAKLLTLVISVLKQLMHRIDRVHRVTQYTSTSTSASVTRVN